MSARWAFLLRLLAGGALLTFVWPSLAGAYFGLLAPCIAASLAAFGLMATVHQVSNAGIQLQVSAGGAAGSLVSLTGIEEAAVNWVTYMALVLATPLHWRHAARAAVAGTAILVLSHLTTGVLMALVQFPGSSAPSGAMSGLLVMAALGVVWPFVLWFLLGSGLEVVGVGRRMPRAGGFQHFVLQLVASDSPSITPPSTPAGTHCHAGRPTTGYASENQ